MTGKASSQRLVLPRGSRRSRGPSDCREAARHRLARPSRLLFAGRHRPPLGGGRPSRPRAGTPRAAAEPHHRDAWPTSPPPANLWPHARATLWRVLVGFVIGASAGIVFGAISGSSETTRRLLDPTLQALRAIPSIAWVPLFILWLGIFEASKVALIAIGVFFPVYLGIAGAILSRRPQAHRGRPRLPAVAPRAWRGASCCRPCCRRH